MRVLLPGFVAGLAVSTLLAGLPYLFDRRGDPAIGYWIYIFQFLALAGSLLFATATMLGTLKFRGSGRTLPLPLAFMVVLASYVLAFLLIVRLAYGFWVWQASPAEFIPCLIVGCVSTGMFVLSSRIRLA